MRTDIDIFPFHRQTLPALLEARRDCERTFITDGTNELLYSGAAQLAGQYADMLAREGVNKGDRLVVFCSNRIEMLYIWLGAMWSGAVLVPINTAFRGEQLRNMLAIAKPTLILSEADLLPFIADVKDALGSTKHIRVIADGDVKTPDSIGDIPVSAWQEPDGVMNAAAISASDAAAILYTSGTSGPSKGVICPHAQFYWWGVLNAKYLDIHDDAVLHTVLPFFHTNALNTLWQAMVTGATYSFAPRFSASKFWSQIRASGATVTYLLGAMIFILMKSEARQDDRDHKLRIALSPSTSPELVEAFKKRFGVQLVEGYASTETNLVFSNALEEIVPGTMGRPDENFETRVVDEHDCAVPDGTPGELVVRAHQPFSMASGYFGNPEATVKAWRNLWFHTGDLVVCDDNGVYQFLDRLKDSIRRRGENISSSEVEQALLQHKDIENAAVIGVPSELGEEEVLAYIVPVNGRQCDLLEITASLENNLAYFAIPRYIVIVAELPLTENGKVKKYVLKESGIPTDAWDREQKTGPFGPNGV